MVESSSTYSMISPSTRSVICVVNEMDNAFGNNTLNITSISGGKIYIGNIYLILKIKNINKCVAYFNKTNVT